MEVIAVMAVDEVGVRTVAQKEAARAPKPISESKLAGTKVNELKAEAVQVRVDREAGTQEEKLARANLNSVLDVVNVTRNATLEIGNILESIGGIAEQAAKEDTNSDRRKVLEEEGNSLIQEVQRIARETEIKGVRPLAGDSIRLELEETLGRTLETILPDKAERAFELASVDFSTADSIIDTRTRVERAEQAFESLREAVDQTATQLQEQALELDVAIQNSAAAESSVRDLEQALLLAQQTGQSIESNAQNARESHAGIKPSALELLK